MYRATVASLFIFLVIGCKPASTPEVAEVSVPLKPAISGMFADFLAAEDTLRIQSQISQMLRQDDPEVPTQIHGLTLSEADQLIAFYSSNSYKPAWVTTTLVDSVFLELNNIESDGFNAEDYAFKEVDQLIKKLKTSHLDPQDWAELDIFLTHALLKYGKHLLLGKVDPKSLSETWNFPPRSSEKPLGALLFDVRKQGRLQFYFTTLRPQHPLYTGMRLNLLRYRQLVLDGQLWTPLLLSSKKQKLEPGDTNEMVPELCKRLAKEGFLTDDYLLKDTTLIYTPAIAGCLAKFQQMHGLYPDSVVGKTTLDLLNLSLEEKINSILCNLERMRWVAGNLKGDFILVNAAQFRLWFFQADTVTWSTEVIIGTPYNATPFFTAAMQRVIFNPTWTVPYSIATKEMLPKLKRNRGYLASQNMMLLTRNGERVNPSGVNFSHYSASNFPYVIRQQPGQNNALGQVKFELPNPYSIYLHDTPSKQLFDKDQRAFSHGCIRVNNPLKLAELVLARNDGWNSDSIASILKSGKTTPIGLQKDLPVLLAYVTHYTDAHGNAYFFKDIYKRDKKLLAALQKP